ncbi:MAG TPA: 2-succinyl-5-enolpyruvyl-6-hydroxy-3-cyclohexene-1-carboxylic-acid synthase [Myxococcales bacterium]|nr:2-succinyl-5-enolpyruvyl-6-hydroxy-3-cyclohexene-1-carboxylic-acid synthase [Myxococcales bacterium]
MTPPFEVNAAWAAAIVDELCAAGATEAVICPGSRSTPLALACAADRRLRVRSIVDERSGAFFALGAAKASGRPAIALATSGTAGAHFYPAILEAEASRVPLVAITADRPPELHGFGAPQTIDQQHLYGAHPRFFADLGIAEGTVEGLRHARAVIAAALARAVTAPRGPIHLNVPFREPLAPVRGDRRTAPPASAAVRVCPGALEPDPAALEAAARELSRRARGVIVCGPRDSSDALPDAVRALSESLGYPVLAEAASQIRFRLPEAVTHYDALLKHEPLARAARPEAVVRLGGGLTSKTLQQWLDASGAWTLAVSDDGVLFDPGHSASLVVCGDAVRACAELARRIQGREPRPESPLLRAERMACRALDEAFAAEKELSEPGVARALAAELPEESLLFVSSSMPVRDVDSWASAGRARVLSNRGVNGIDGVVSSALGAAAATERPAAVLLGDLALLHDLSGMVAARRLGIPLLVVVVNNDGGGIFQFLPIAEATEHFEELFATPHGLELGHVAELCGARFERPRTAAELRTCIRDNLGSRFCLVEVRTDRAANVERHRELQRIVAAALEAP